MHNKNTRRRRKREKKKEIFETIMAGIFPKLMSDTKPQVQEAQRTPSRINVKNKNIKKGLTPRYSISHYRKSKIKKYPERSQRKKVPT